MEGLKTIYSQMENCICKIGEKDTGFFCYIPYNGIKLPVLITAEGIIYNNCNNKQLIVSMNNNTLKKTINLDENNILYRDKKSKIIIIRIRSHDNLNNINFLEYDEDSSLYGDKSLYILHYKEKDKSSVNFCSVNNQVGQYLIYSCEIESLGAPIINLENNKVIGLTIKDKIAYYDVLVGSILKYALNDLNKIKNQIKITLEVEEWELSKNCYFLDNTVDYEDKDGIK